jgi:hypothetical protein
MHALVLAAAVALAPALQEKPAVKTPQKGDSVVVKGCLRGNSLESTETGILNSDATMMTALVYRLTGDKATLKSLRAEHDGKVVEVTGILKSKLPSAADERGMTVGNTRVRIGVGPAPVGSPAHSDLNRSIPVLEVKGFEGRAVQCGG